MKTHQPQALTVSTVSPPRHADTKRLLTAAQAEEEALEGLFQRPVQEVTLRIGTESMTVAVSPETGWAIVHELLLAAGQKCDRLTRHLSAR